jgi:glycosidase
MKKKLLFINLLLVTLFSYAQVTISPNPFEMSDEITITVDVNSNDPCNGLVNPTKVYMHSGAGDDTNAFGFNVVGNWGQDDGVGEMTSIGGGLWAITITPETYYTLTPTQLADVTQLGFVFRNANGSQQFYGNDCPDFEAPVGAFQLSLDAPTDSPSIVTAGSSISVQATTTQTADFTLRADGAIIDTQNGITNYSFSPTVNSTTSYVLEATNGPQTLDASFQVIVTPTVTQEAIPAGIVEGVNYDDTDDTKVTLAVRIPNKDYVYVAGSFNNYEFNDNFVMKQDGFDTDLYWLEITGLTPGQNYTYQYWVVDESPIAGSPAIVKTADPYSPVVLSPFDDPGISNYPNIPTYPAGQEREVTLIQPGATPYPWVVDNFEKPKKEDLIVYEVLIRDFDADRSYQNLIDRIDYFKDLKINAIQLMPIMEYDGNESWGYNTSFHYALDKFYGSPDKFKEFVDLCHQNGIAVILDIALNHATGRNPLVRMWMDDPDGDGWGGPSSENPYFNTVPQHDYNVFNDFNHQSLLTQSYTKRVVQHWIEEYKIDGFRWDLTKGFTQNCGPGSQPGCTDGYHQDRVDVLQDYADFSWNIDETHYVIFEHLGQDGEEQQWANYRLNEATPKGIMMWGKMTTEYKDFLLGFSSNISRATHQSRGFTAPRLMMYPESHDEERIMYEAVTFGNTSNSSHNVRNLDIALKRMASIGAVSLTIPGPKMIWHFSSLGMDDSIWTCSDGVTVTPGDDGCKLATKPQPQWAENWLSDPDRRAVYDDWARLIDLKINEDVFEGDFVLEGDSQNVRMFVFDTSIPDGQLKSVVILANFNITDQNITPDFPGPGTWYNLIDNTTITVNSTTDPILVPAGEFRIFGNAPATLSTEDLIISDDVAVYPNPANTHFQINKRTTDVTIYNLLGKEVAKFSGDFAENYQFTIDQLETGMYVVRAASQEGTIVKRLIKE